MTRMQEVRAELATIAAAQEARATNLLDRAIRALEEVSGPDYPGRIAVRNEAQRLRLVLEREAPSFSRIVARAT